MPKSVICISSPLGMYCRTHGSQKMMHGCVLPCGLLEVLYVIDDAVPISRAAGDSTVRKQGNRTFARADALRVGVGTKVRVLRHPKKGLPKAARLQPHARLRKKGQGQCRCNRCKLRFCPRCYGPYHRAAAPRSPRRRTTTAHTAAPAHGGRAFAIFAAAVSREA